MSVFRVCLLVIVGSFLFSARVFALPSFEQVKSYVARNPNNLKARYLLGKMYLKQGNREETLREWKYVVRKRPHLWKVYYKIGLVQYKIGVASDVPKERLKSWKKAMRVWQHVIEGDKDGRDGRKARSAYLKVKAKYVKLANSVSGYSSERISTPSQGSGYSIDELKALEPKAGKFYKNGDYDEAAKLYKILYDNKFHEKQSLYFLGKSTLKDAEEPEVAVKYLTMYGKKYEDSADLQEKLGQAYGLCAEFRKQIKCYKKSLSYEDCNKADIHFQLAQAYDRLCQHSKTIEHAQLAIQINPDYKKKLQPLIKNSNLAQDVGSIVDEVLKETEDSQLSDEQINEFARRVGDILGEESITSGTKQLKKIVNDKDKMQSIKDAFSGRQSSSGTSSGRRRRSY